MKALSIRQPWASLIVHHGKDVENRTWRTSYRGPLLIHAAKAFDVHALSVEAIAHYRDVGLSIEGILSLDDVPRGGLIGIVDLVGCDKGAPSVWAMPDRWHWLLSNPRALPFQRLKGKLGLFEVEQASRTVGGEARG